MINEFTTDNFFNGRLTVKQAREGYRFSVDAVILASRIRPKPGDRILDLGTGCGIIPLMLAYRYPHSLVYGVEVQQELAHLAHMNVQDNGMQNQVKILHQDMRTIKQTQVSGPVQIVLSNPPYRKADSGRINPNSQRAVARHEIKVTLKDVLQVAAAMLKTGGRFFSIYTAERMTDLLISMHDCRLEPKLLRFIHSRKDAEAKRVLVEAIHKGHPGLEVVPPLVIYHDDGIYTAEMASMFDP